MLGRQLIFRRMYANASKLTKNVLITIGTWAANKVTVSVILQDLLNQRPITSRQAVDMYLSTSKMGAPIAADIEKYTITKGTKLAEIVSGGTYSSYFKVLANSECQIDLYFEPVASMSYYLHVVLPDGQIIVSDAIAVTI